MNVVADGGLVGIVTDVGANYATVRSIIDDSSRVGVCHWTLPITVLLLVT